MMSHVLSQVGFSRRMAIWFFTNKLAQKSPWTFVIMFLFGAMFMASFMSQTAAAADLPSHCGADLQGAEV